jgi:hypothetical protein
MVKARYLVKAVVSREGDNITGPFLGRTATLTDAFIMVGEAIEKDQGSAGRNLMYVIHDEENDSQSWTIFEPIG